MGKNNRSLSDRRHEIYSTWISCGQKTREAARELKIDPSVIGKYVAIVEAEIAAGEWTAPVAPEVPIEQRVAADRGLQRAVDEVRDLREKYKHTLAQIAELESQNEAILAIKSPVEPFTIKADPGKDGGEAVAIIQASDWHVEEKVDPSTVGGRNEYNPDIAEARARMFFQNGLKLIRKERQGVAIDRVILALSGDLVSGFIHEELEESNYLSPVEAIQFVKRLVIGGLKLWKEDGGFKEILVATNYGNHGRTTKKIRVSTGHRNSYEWMAAGDLAAMFDGDEVIRFQTTNSYFNFVRCFGHSLRFHHGDAVKYGGGIGGLTIPLLRYVSKSNLQHPADADFIGHFHQLTPYSRAHRFVVNGSLIGFNAYAQRIGASPEPPMQSFHLLDSEKGFTVSAPIFCQEEKKGKSFAGKGKR